VKRRGNPTLQQWVSIIWHKVTLLQDCSEIATLPGVQRQSARNDRLVVPVDLFCHCEERNGVKQSLS